MAEVISPHFLLCLGSIPCLLWLETAVSIGISTAEVSPNASPQRWFSASEKNCKKKKGRGGRDSHLCRLLLRVLTFLYFLVFFSSECSGSCSVCILFQVYSCCQWEDWTIEAYTVILEFESTVDFWVFCVSTSCINCPPNIFVLFFFHVGGFFFF